MLCCEECGCVSDRARGWIAQIVHDPDNPEEGSDVVLHCPVCAQREFGVASRRGLPYT